MQLNLNLHDTEALRDMLRDYLPALRLEVARTDQREYRHRLAERQELVERLLDELTQPPVP